MEMALTAGKEVPSDDHQASLHYMSTTESDRSTVTAFPLMDASKELYRSYNSSSSGTRSLVQPTSYASYQIQSHQVLLRSIGNTREVLTNAPYNDGHMWRKYGEKKITGFAFRRYYYRCTYKEDQGCPAIKQVHQQQKYLNDTPMYLVVYKKKHTCNTNTATTYRISEGSPEDDHQKLIEPTRPFSLHFNAAAVDDHEHHEANLWSVSWPAAVDTKGLKKVEADEHSKDSEVRISTTDPDLLSNNSDECSTSTVAATLSISRASSEVILMKSDNSILEKMNDHQITSLMDLNYSPSEVQMTNFWSAAGNSTYDDHDPLTWNDTSYMLMENPLWWW